MGKISDLPEVTSIDDNDYLLTDIVPITSTSTSKITKRNAFAGRPFVTVGFSNADYICDGVDDQVQINNALTISGRVFLKKAAYNVSSSITLTGVGKSLEMEDGGILTLANGSNTAVVKIGDGSSTTSEIVLENLNIDANKDNQTPNSGDGGSGIYVNVASQVVLSNAKVTNARTFGIQFNASTNFTVANSVVTTPGGTYNVLAAGDGVFIGSSCSYGQVRNVYVNTPYRIGVTIDAGGGTATSYIKVVSCYVKAGDRGYHVENAVYCSIDNSTVLNSTGVVFGNGASSNETASPAILLGDNTAHTLVSACSVVNCQAGISPTNSASASLVGNVVSGSTWFGIMLKSTNNSTVDCNIVDNCTTNGIYITGSNNNSIVGNALNGNTSIGIYLLSTAAYNLISANSVNNTANDGIRTDNASNNTFSNNSITNSSNNGIDFIRSSFNTASNNQITNSSQSTNNTFAGIFIKDSGGTNSTKNVIIGNVITDTASNKSKYSVRENASTDDYNVVVANQVSGAVTTGISIQGVNSVSANNIST